MTEYSFDKARYEKVAREYTLKQAVIGIVIAAIFAVFGIFLLLVGVLSDKEALNYSIGAFGLCAVVVLLTVLFYYSRMKTATEWFKNKFPQGRAVFAIELTDRTALTVTMSNGDRRVINFNEVEKIVGLKDYYGIIVGKGCIFVEKNAETASIIEQITI